MSYIEHVEISRRDENYSRYQKGNINIFAPVKMLLLFWVVWNTDYSSLKKKISFSRNNPVVAHSVDIFFEDNEVARLLKIMNFPLVVDHQSKID